MRPSVFPAHKLPPPPKYLCRNDPWGSSWYHQILRRTYKVRVDPLRGRNRHGALGQRFQEREQLLEEFGRDKCHKLGCLLPKTGFRKPEIMIKLKG